MDESATRFAIDKLKEKLNFEIEDFNFDDKEHYKYMYERINNRYEDLQYEYRQLEWEHKLSINRCKHLMDDYINLKKEVQRYRKIFRPDSESSIDENNI